MKIKIVKSSRDTYWYRDSAGKIFEVIDELDDCFRVIRDKNTASFGFVMKEDAQVIPFKEFNTLTEIVEQLESCHYITEDSNHSLEMNVAFIALKEMAKRETDG